MAEIRFQVTSLGPMHGAWLDRVFDEWWLDKTREIMPPAGTVRGVPDQQTYARPRDLLDAFLKLAMTEQALKAFLRTYGLPIKRAGWWDPPPEGEDDPFYDGVTAAIDSLQHQAGNGVNINPLIRALGGYDEYLTISEFVTLRKRYAKYHADLTEIARHWDEPTSDEGVSKAGALAAEIEELTGQMTLGLVEREGTTFDLVIRPGPGFEGILAAGLLETFLSEQPRLCEACSKKPVTRSNQKYCSARCRERAKKQRARDN